MPLRKVLAASALAVAFALPAASAPTGLHVVARIAGPDGGWDYASFDPARRRVYITHGSTVMTVDADSGQANPAFATGARLHAATPVPGTDVLITTNSGDNTARVISALDGHQLASIPTAEDPDGATFDPSTGLVIIVGSDSGTLTFIDPKAMKSVGVLAVGGKLEFGAPDGQWRYFVNVEDKNQVAVVDLKSRTIVARYALPGCERPTGLAVVSGGRVISDCGNGGVVILDAGTGKAIATFTVGGFPDAVLFDPTRDLAFVPSARDGKLTVIALSGSQANTIADTVTTQIGARTGAVDPKTGRVFLPTAEYILPVPPGQRPTTKPGTFVVLELDR